MQLHFDNKDKFVGITKAVNELLLEVLSNHDLTNLDSTKLGMIYVEFFDALVEVVQSMPEMNANVSSDGLNFTARNLLEYALGIELTFLTKKITLDDLSKKEIVYIAPLNLGTGISQDILKRIK